VKRKLNSTEVIDALTDLLILRGVPGYIRSDNGPEFIAKAVRDWIKNCLHRAMATLGKRILREFQWEDAG
jgi:transposase InsO family protein